MGVKRSPWAPKHLPDPEPEPEPEQLVFLSENGDWFPQTILERLGPASEAGEHTSRLLIAAAVTQGARRLQDLIRAIEVGAARFEPALGRLVGDPNFAEWRPRLDKLMKRLATANKYAAAARRRSENDISKRPGGLRLLDLIRVISGATAVVEASGFGPKSSPAGLRRAARLFDAAPTVALMQENWNRLLPGPRFRLEGVLFYWPPAYARTVLVYSDGRLAYDPAPAETPSL
jgi:hypothetical protein